MLAILFYCLKVLLCSGLLFGYYLLALRNKQFHEWNRYYLLLVVILPFALPFIHIPIFYNADNNDANIILRGLRFGDYGDEVIIRPTNNWHINWNTILIILYAAISIFFLIKLLKTFSWINKIKKYYPSEMLEEIQFYNTNENGTPFSFFKNIFWHKDIEPSSSKGLQMLRHEITHVRQLHSADKLLLEITTIIAWWNPFFHLIKKELSTIHEFIADQHAANGDDHLQYASLLLQKAFGSNNVQLSNPFFHSQLKRRIAMLTTIKNPRFSYLRRLMVLPLAAALFMLFAFRYKKTIENQLKSPTQITVVIDAGHGGIDDGALNKNGIKEKNITLAIANKIATLAASRNIKIILTRNNDVLPGGSNNVNEGLKQRLAIATNSGADIFISLHVNTSNMPSSSGIGAFVTKTDNNLMAKNQLIASALLDELDKSGLQIFKQIQQSREQGVLVLDKNPLPAVLLELGFINNPTDAAFITDPKNQEKLANEILDGIVKAAGSLKNKSNYPDNKETVDPKVLQGYWQDSTKKAKSNAKVIAAQTDQLFHGKKIATVTPTTDDKGVFVKTTDGGIYFLNETETKKELNIDLKGNVKGEASSIEVKTDSAKPQPLFVVDGVITVPNNFKLISPDKIQSITVLKNQSATSFYGDAGKNGVILVTTKSEKLPSITVVGYKSPVINTNEIANDNIIADTVNVDGAAQFPGGITGWRYYLMRNLSYPKEALAKNIQGKVRVQLTVNEDGSVQDVLPLNNPGGGLAEEAERIIKKGPKWIPAKQNGQSVSSRFEQIITFQLQ